jgi:autotransporter-associated beta strand protein
MTPTNPSVFRRAVCAAVVATAIVLPATRSVAQTTNDWNGTNSGNWSDPLNWVVQPTPGLLDTNILRFFGNTNYFSTNDFATPPYQLHQLYFSNSGAASNGNTVTLSGNQLSFYANGATSPGISNFGASFVVINNDIAITATNLNLGGTNGSRVTLNGVISGAASLTKAGTLTNVLTTQNLYTGDTIVQAGMLQGNITNNNSTVFGNGGVLRLVGGSLALRSDLTNLVVGPGSGYNVVQGSGSTGVVNVDRLTVGLSTNNIYRLNTLDISNAQFGVTGANGASVVIGGLTSMRGTAAVFNVTAGSLSLEGGISDGGTGVAFRKIGGGRLFLTNQAILGSTAYGGQTFLDAGQVRVVVTNNNHSPLPASTIVLRGGSLEIRTTNTPGTSIIAGPGAGYNFTVAANGSTLDADRIFNSGGTNTIFVNNITFTSNTFGFGVATTNTVPATNLTFNTATGDTLSVAGTVTVLSNALITVPAGTASLDGAISGGSGFYLKKAGAGRLALTNGAANSFTGDTVIDAGQLQVSLSTTNQNALGASGNVLLRGGALEIRTTNTMIAGPGSGYNFTVQSNGSTINSDRIFNTGGTNTVSVNNITFIANTNTGGATNLTFTTGNGNTIRVAGTMTMFNNTLLTVGSNTVLDGLVTDSGSGFYLRKFGVGRLFITNSEVLSNGWAGGTVIDQGQLQVLATSNNPANLGPGNLTMRGGTLEIRASNNLVFGPGAAGYSVTLVSNSTINVDRFDTTSSGNTIDMNALVIAGNTNGSGTNLTVSGANTYSLRFTGPVTLAGTNGSLTPTTNLIINGLISETGGAQSLNKAGAGRLFLTNGVDHLYTGGTFISAGPLQVNMFTNNATTLGSGPLTLRGGTLELRADTNLTFGAGLGYSPTILTSSTIDVNRITTNAVGNTIFVDSINISSAVTNTTSLTVNGGNGFTLAVRPGGTVSGPGGWVLPTVGVGVVSNNNAGANGPINLLGGGFLLFTNDYKFYGDNVISGTRFDGGVTFDGPVSITNASGTIFFDGIVSNGAATGSFTKGGAGTVVFSNAANSFGGDVTLNGGTLQGVGTVSNSTPLGVNPSSIYVNAGTLQLRSATNASMGPGLGYHVIVASNATINVDRSGVTNFGGLNAAQTISIGKLDVNNSRATVTGGNSYRFQANDTTTISNRAFLALTSAQLTMAGQLVESVPNSVLIREGGSNLFYTSSLSPTHTGGTVITNGNAVAGTGYFWRPINAAVSNAGAYVGFYQFGSGAITLDGNATFGFQPNVASNYTFTTPFIIADKVSAGGLVGDGGGTINDTSVNGAAIVTNSGAITLSGTMRVTHGNSVSNAQFTGPITITGADREITVNNNGLAGNSRVIISGNIGSDASTRNLTLRGNTYGRLELSGNNAGVGNIDLAPAYVSTNGGVRFLNTQSLPGGTVTVESGVSVGIGFPVTSPLLTSKFIFKPDSLVALEGSKAAPSVTLDLSATGLNADIRIGALDSVNYSLTNAITPFANVFKLGGGGGTLTLAGTNQLTGAGNSLSVGSHPYLTPLAPNMPGTLDLSTPNVVNFTSNTFGGGTVVNLLNTLNIRSGRTNTPLGAGAIDVYGTLQAIAGASNLNYGSLAGPDGLTNNNVVRLQPASTLVLGDTGSSTGPGGTNRYGDNEAVTLNAARLNLVGRNLGVLGTAGSTNTETIGALNYALGSRLNIQAAAAANTNNATFLTVASLNRVGTGTLQLLRNASSATNDTSFGAQSRVISTAGAGTVVNGMISPHIYNETDNSFVTYVSTPDASGFALGITNATFTGGTDFSGTGGTTIYDLQGGGSNVTVLSAPQSVYALRTISNAIRGGQDVTIGSGGFSAGNVAVAHDARFIFGSLATPSEGLLYVNGNTATFSNDFVASRITKFGPGAISLANSNRTYANGWDINWGTVNVLNTNGLGPAVAGNSVVLGNGQNTVVLQYNQNINGTFNSGPITSYDRNTIGFTLGAASRVQTIAPMGLTLDTIASGPVGSYLRVTMDQTLGRAIVGGATTLAKDSFLDIASTGQTTGPSNRFELGGGLVGTGKSLTKIGNGALGLTGDNSGTWIGGRITNMSGTLHVGDNGALGDATSSALIKSNSVLQLSSSLVNYISTAPVTQEKGSAERWLGAFNRFSADATAQSFTIPDATLLQVSTDMSLVSNKTIRLGNGSGLEGYQFTDDARGNSITLGRLVTVELAGSNTKIGQSGVDYGRVGTQFNVLGNVTESGGSRSLTKVGLDILNLAGNNTFSGGLNVNRGIVLLGNNTATNSGVSTNGFSSGTGPVVVNTQGMLGGTNGAIGGTLTVASGGVLMPGLQGTSASMLANNGLTLQGGSILDMDITTLTNNDTMFVTGTVDIQSGAKLNLRLGVTVPSTATNVFVLISNDGTDPVTGSFAGLVDNSLFGGLPEGATILFRGNDSDSTFSGLFAISYVGGDGNDVVLTVVPEPGQVALMVLGGALVGWQVIRRRRQS